MWVVGASAEENGIAFPDYAPSSTLSASYIPRNISSQPIILHISTFCFLALLRLVPERKLGRIAMTSIPIISIIIAPVIFFCLRMFWLLVAFFPDSSFSFIFSGI